MCVEASGIFFYHLPCIYFWHVLPPAPDIHVFLARLETSSLAVSAHVRAGTTGTHFPAQILTLVLEIQIHVLLKTCVLSPQEAFYRL